MFGLWKMHERGGRKTLTSLLEKFLVAVQFKTLELSEAANYISFFPLVTKKNTTYAMHRMKFDHRKLCKLKASSKRPLYSICKTWLSK